MNNHQNEIAEEDRRVIDTASPGDMLTEHEGSSFGYWFIPGMQIIT